MRKSFIILVVLQLAFFLFACKPEEENHQFSQTFYYMDTFISVGGMTKSQSHADEILNQIDIIFDKYHQLAHNFEGLNETSSFLENVYTLNRKIGQRVEIDLELYAMLVEAEAYKNLTNGYFDISIGKMVDAWKDFVQSEDHENRHQLFEQITERVDQIDMTDFDIVLEEENGRYYVTLFGEDMKIDLGALAKGYAAQVATDYLIEEGLEYYFVTAGSSSIMLGLKEDSEDNFFRVGLAHPVDLSFPRVTYGRLFAKNTSVTTSANYEQFMLHEDKRYHHIVSPITRRPMQYYHALTLIGPNAGFLDAVGTALFSMNEKDLLEWMEHNREIYQLEMVYFREDGTIGLMMTNTVFEARKP